MSAFLITVYIVCGVYLLINFKHDIHMLQQNSYRTDRYWRWLRKSDDLMSAWRLVDLAMIFMLFASNMLDIRLVALIVSIVALIKMWLIAKKRYKKPLVFTKRVWRIYSVTAIIALAIYLTVILICGNRMDIFGIYACASFGLGVCFAMTFLSWAIVIISLTLLSPVEKMINRKYYNQARNILKSMPDLTIIGITGSYGKTSTKHYLHRILSENYDTLMTPGSYNTPMGVIRTVREMMKPYHQIFICEMGAKQKGDIKEICDLVDPQIGVVTAVGPMHLESFKTIENVQSTKFELIDALPEEGLAVINNDFEYCANRKVDNVKCIRYGISDPSGCEYVAEDLEFTPQGTYFTVKSSEGYEQRMFTRLVGECNISNLLAAIVIGRYLNIPDNKIANAVADIQQVEHRLNIKQTPGGITIIDDAFNSNPSGSKMAVDVLSTFRKNGKRIIVTPGMIELGERQYELNKEFGKYLAQNVDIAYIVGQYNRDAILEGINSTDFNQQNIIIVDTFTDAQRHLQTVMQKGDTVLYENDLPDSFK